MRQKSASFVGRLAWELCGTKPKAFIFDLHGTLVPFYPEHFLKSINNTLSTLGHPQLSDLSQSQSIHHTLAKYAKNDEELQKAYCLFVNSFIFETELMPGAKSLLNMIHSKGIKIGMVSNLKQDLLICQMAKLGITDYFQTIIGSSDEKSLKPNPELLKRAFTDLCISPKTGYYIGDTHTDILCAQRVGCRSILLGKAKTIKPDIQVDNLHTLESILHFRYFNPTQLRYKGWVSR